MVFRKIEGDVYSIGYGWRTGAGISSGGRRNDTHNVKFPESYYYAIFRTTAGQHARIVGDTTAATRAKTSPVSETWNTLRGSAGILAKPTSGPIYELSRKTNLAIDLPSHAMHEAACRARSTARLVDGTANATEAIDQYAWHANNCGSYSDSNQPPVGLKLPTEWGFYDTVGGYHQIFRDCWPGSSYVDNVEAAFANNFIPISTGNTSYRLCAGSQFKYGRGDTDICCFSNLWGDLAASSSSNYRLAVYPKGYYPNGGK